MTAQQQLDWYRLEAMNVPVVGKKHVSWMHGMGTDMQVLQSYLLLCPRPSGIVVHVLDKHNNPLSSVTVPDIINSSSLPMPSVSGTQEVPTWYKLTVRFPYFGDRHLAWMNAVPTHMSVLQTFFDFCQHLPGREAMVIHDQNGTAVQKMPLSSIISSF